MKKREKIKCVCGCEISRSGKSKHEKNEFKYLKNFIIKIRIKISLDFIRN